MSELDITHYLMFILGFILAFEIVNILLRIYL